MAKYKSNQSKKSEEGSGGTIAKMGIFALILGLLYMGFQKLLGKEETPPTDLPAVVEPEENAGEASAESLYYLPSTALGEVVSHQFYAISYVEKYEQPEWVAYELTADRLNAPWVDRTDNFRPDHMVAEGSATPNDYRNTKYDRGHLCPAADMAFSEQAMSETFLLSNISPQEPGFNKGVWRELEELTRDWAKRSKHLYVVTGPVLTQPIKFWIGENQVAVPPSYYKVLLDLEDPERKAIGFVLPNETSDERIESFATTVDEVEKLTGINFFQKLLPPAEEAGLEANFDLNLWKSNDKKYQIRVKQWNLQQ